MALLYADGEINDTTLIWDGVNILEWTELQKLPKILKKLKPSYDDEKKKDIDKVL